MMGFKPHITIDHLTHQVKKVFSENFDWIFWNNLYMQLIVQLGCSLRDTVALKRLNWGLGTV